MDSKQWAKDLPVEVRDVLDAGVSVSAPSGTKQAVWSALATKLPAAGAGAAAGGLTAFSVLKPLAVGLALGAAMTVGVIEIRSKLAGGPGPSASASARRVTPAAAEPRPSELAPQPVNEPAAAESLAPTRALKAADASVPTEGAPPPTPRAAPIGESAPSSGASSMAAFPDAAPTGPREDATVLESRRLNQARAALQAGDARGALLQLDAIAVDFPRGVLGQEREALRIEALLGLGERERARELARRFLARHPHSPHAAAVERALH